MRKFEDLHIEEQNCLLIAMLGLIVVSGARSIRDVADDKGITVEELWHDVCADAGLDACHPWAGFPDRPQNLPEARGNSPLTSAQLAIAAKLSRINN
jgi:hypothetical protein